VQAQGSSVCRLYLVVQGAAPTAASAPVETPSSPVAPQVTVETEDAKAPAPTPKAAPAVPKAEPAPASSSSSASAPKPAVAEESKPSAEAVLKLLRSFFNDASVQAAIPGAACLFLDSVFTSQAEVRAAVTFTLDAFPVIKSHPLSVLAVKYLDVAAPFLEAALQPLRELNAVMPQALNGVKGSIAMFAPLLLPMLAEALNSRVNSALLEKVWAVVTEWARDPSRPFPIDALKVIVLPVVMGCRGAAAGPAADATPAAGPCGAGAGFGPFAGLFGGRGGWRGHHGHGLHHGGVPPFGPFGPRGCHWRQRQAAREQAAQSEQAAPSNPLSDILSALGGGVSVGANGLNDVLSGLLGGHLESSSARHGAHPPCQSQQQQQQQQSQQSASSSSASAPTVESQPKESIWHGVTCDGCSASPIVGLRYKCTVCNDFDLCATCEAKDAHPVDHPLLKMTTPPTERKQHGGCPWRGFGGRGFGHGFGHAHGHGRWGHRNAAAEGQSPALSSKFVSDVNLPDRTPVEKSSVLLKKWLIINDGSASWPAATKLIFVRGDRELSDAEEFAVPFAAPGEQVEVTAVLRTPAAPGRYQAFYRLADENRRPFGVKLWADLFVVADAPKPATNAAASSSAPKPAPLSVEVPVTVEPRAAMSPVAATVKAPELPVAQPVAAPKPAAAAPDAAVAAASPVVKSVEESVSSPSASSASANKYALQLELLSSMGFKNAELNAFLLEANAGDVTRVAGWLLERIAK